MKDLPKFRTRARVHVLALIQPLLVNPSVSDKTQLYELLEYEDGHYRAIFNRDYFTLASGQTEPSKSQWNTLKKKLKRHDRAAFVFKEHGEIDCEHDERGCCYLDFGFFASPR